MKSKLSLLGLILITVLSSSTFATTDTYIYTGASETFVVPAGVSVLTIEAWGAQGGFNSNRTDNLGGYSKGDLSVSPGDTLYIYVGEQPSGLTGGFNGGGSGDSGGAGGGGASDVRTFGNTLNDRVIVAAGGGAGGLWSGIDVVGGVGGGLSGGDGYRDVPSTAGGEGGTQISSGNGTCVSFNNPTVAGSFGIGGTTVGKSCGCEGYGGGGGWYGGAASGNCRGGGGGSSYIAALSAASTQPGVRSAHGEIKITYTDSYTVGGSISGLSGSVTLQNNGGDDLVLNADGNFSFGTPLATTDNYNVTILVQPALQTCTVTSGSGTVAAADITNISIACVLNPVEPVPTVSAWGLGLLVSLLGYIGFVRRRQHT